MINNERLVKTFLELVQIDSPTGFESEMAENVAFRLRKMGVNPLVDYWGNVTAKLPGDAAKKPRILNAHLDTVEPGRGIRPEIVDGVIKPIGDTILGADNKAGVAAILETAAVLSEEEFKDNAPIDLVFTVHEESETDGPRLLDYKKIKSRFGYSFDSSQPLGTITMASPFYNRFDLRVDGVSQHSSSPESAANALTVTAKALSNLRVGRLDEDSVRNIRIADAQTIISNNPNDRIVLTRNTIPGSMIGRGEVRSFQERLVELYSFDVKLAFMNAISASCQSKMYNLDFRSARENGGFKYSRDDSDVVVTEGILRRLGMPINHDYGFGCYDANVFAEMGVKIINLGDGAFNPHTKDEQIPVENLVKLGNLIHHLSK